MGVFLNLLGGNKMNNQTDYVKVIFQYEGAFHDDTYKQYIFTNNLSNLEIGDLVVVDTQNGYQVVKVVDFTSSDGGHKNPRHLIQKIDLGVFEETKEEFERIKDLEREIEARIKKAERVKRMKEVAEASGDEKLASMIKELEDLSK